MIDLEHVRQNRELYKQAAARKRIALDIDALIETGEKLRQARQELDDLRRQRNELTDQIGKKAPQAEGEINIEAEEKKTLIARARTVGDAIAARQAEYETLKTRFARLEAFVPGLPCPGVPDGGSDDDNVELRRVGEVARKPFALKDHMQLATLHNMVEQDGPRLIAGSRAYALKGTGALLELAVLRFALDSVVARGLTPILPPLMVKENAMYGTGYFPLGEDNAYALTEDKLYLTGTSEVGMMAMHMDQTLELQELPLRYAGMTPCFRREAGSAGRDVKGLYRVHQFQKVEQVVICRNDEALSLQEHNNLLQNAEDILQALELPYRVVAVCAGEMGLGQVRKHDIETWMPSRDAYGETHSCSSFHDFQARRLGLKYRDEEGRKIYAHTLNNTAIASPRILIALLENHQQADGSIYVPVALRPYLGGREILEPPVKQN
ncbi:MAG: serine--tRNA ligase [Cyanobacteria bacterium SZAS LIN-3]|nr:serine--tRNA ligase [Cyanobacteria bacterium SZAS LIN-3]